MTPPASRAALIRGGAGMLDGGLRASTDLSASFELLDAVRANPGIGTVVRIYRPRPTLAFSRRETLLPRFEEAAAEAVAFGFVPVVRPCGGRAVPLDAGWIVMDVVSPEMSRRDNRQVFEAHGATLVALLRAFDIDARLGPVAGEYCPGEWSVNARGRVKIVGTAQRVARGARLFAASIPVRVSVAAGEVIDRVNGLLDLDWDPATLGGLDAEAPHLTDTALEAALIRAFAGDDTAECSLSGIVAGAR